MADVTASATRSISAPAFRIRRMLADYETVRPRILTDHFRDYVLHSGTVGEGTVAGWTLQATSKRVREVVVDVSLPMHDKIVETDRNSTMVTTWKVTPGPPVTCTVTVTSTWQGAGGIGGFFERRFAPKALGEIYDGVLANLERLAAEEPEADAKGAEATGATGSPDTDGAAADAGGESDETVERADQD
ncbi:Polyketide cyclase/dehydrase [Pseudonocardia dioxanivorans CB1190]|uniref:Polyketide cyclase/dehydrase n=1 Tax=Pseudonocardia dioxanivorans (strain ATCC 55486 / DSM 44775 / JCM 13855 / CB1190) TaxID=675635 RepID=F4CND0_PSEUX|nr:Polyketide cyclase/dehydrase [Pseudonocardia dioxanivorans CB1190]GJF07223.1 polyketide cyclase [Pseudonocardia sp. D17]